MAGGRHHLAGMRLVWPVTRKYSVAASTLLSVSMSRKQSLECSSPLRAQSMAPLGSSESRRSEEAITMLAAARLTRT